MAAIVVTVTVTGKLVHHHPFLSVNSIIRGGETRCEFAHCTALSICIALAAATPGYGVFLVWLKI